MHMSRMAVVVVMSGMLVLAAACGAAKTTTTTSKGHGFAANPAITVAGEITRLATVAPFTSAQKSHLLPILESLEKDPNASSTVLSKDATEMEDIFTAAPKTELKTHSTAAPGSFAHRSGPSGSASFHFFRSGSGAGPTTSFSGRPSGTFSGAHSFAGGSFTGSSFIYTAAIDALEGKTFTRPGASSSSSSSGSSSSASSSGSA